MKVWTHYLKIGNVQQTQLDEQLKVAGDGARKPKHWARFPSSGHLGQHKTVFGPNSAVYRAELQLTPY